MTYPSEAKIYEALSLVQNIILKPRDEALMQLPNTSYSVINIGQILAQCVPALDAVIRCPKCHQMGMVFHTIIHLNDTHRWTRETIADWLESLDIDLQFKEPELKSEKEYIF